MANVAQLVRARPCGGRCRGFESPRSPQILQKNIYILISLLFFIVIIIKAKNNGPMVELVDTLDLGSSAARCEGSSPFRPTI